jgi:hypothetical protein
MSKSAKISKRLLNFCEEQYQEVRFREGEGKLIARGLRAAREAIESVPLDDPGYLDRIYTAVEACRERFLKDPEDPDGWSLGGIRTILNEIERIRDRT